MEGEDLWHFDGDTNNLGWLLLPDYMNMFCVLSLPAEATCKFSLKLQSSPIVKTDVLVFFHKCLGPYLTYTPVSGHTAAWK